MENVEKGRKTALSALHSPFRFPVEKLHAFSTALWKERTFHTRPLGNPRETWEKDAMPPAYRRELMLVLISFTVSAKVGLFFICSSTLSREWMTVE